MMRNTKVAKLPRKIAVVTASLIFVLAGCASSNTQGESGNDQPAAMKIGLLLPEITVLRYEEKDKPYFTAALSSICPTCELLYANAASDASRQLQQAQSMLTQGADVLVVGPFDAVSAASIVAAATEENVPVVSYDRLIQSPDVAFSITNDYLKVGELQATALLTRLKELGVTPADGGILMLVGAETSPNALNMTKGAHSVIDGTGWEILSEFATYDPVEAQDWTASQLTKFRGQIVGMYSANDGNAGGAISAMKAVGIDEIPPITGLDASLAGLQSIIVGDQYMSVYNPFKALAEAAAQAAVDLANGKTPKASTEVDGIPTFRTEPIAVTVDNIMDTVIKDEFYTVSEICTSNYADACAAAGIK